MGNWGLGFRVWGLGLHYPIRTLNYGELMVNSLLLVMQDFRKGEFGVYYTRLFRRNPEEYDWYC